MINATQITPTQMHLLKLFSFDKSESRALEIKNVLMRYFQNLSFKEIAEATGVGINTALGRMRYAILNMRRMAEEHQIALTI